MKHFQNDEKFNISKINIKMIVGTNCEPQNMNRLLILLLEVLFAIEKVLSSQKLSIYIMSC